MSATECGSKYSRTAKKFGRVVQYLTELAT